MKKIKIVGEIGWEVMARDVDRQLSFAKGEDVEIEIATPGGLISEGLKMFNSIKNYAGDVTFRMTGVVASMGSYVVLARGVENIQVEPNAIFMMHNPLAGAFGDYRVAAKLAANLEALSGHVAQTYAQASDTPVDEIRTMLDDETYLYGADIVARGFAGEITDTEPEEGAPEASAAVAVARVSVDACMSKVRSHEVTEDEVKELSAMVMSITGHKPTPPAKAEPVQKKEEVRIMDRTELEAKHPALYAEVVAEGRELGIGDARARAKSIMAYREKFPKLHKVIDDAVVGGSSMAEFNLDIMAAQSVAVEVDAATGEVTKTPKGGDIVVDAPEMVGGVMTTPEHLGDTSAALAQIAGLPSAGGNA